MRKRLTVAAFLLSSAVAAAQQPMAVHKTVVLTGGRCADAEAQLLDQLVAAAAALCPAGARVSPRVTPIAPEGVELLGCNYAGEPGVDDVTAKGRMGFDCR